jgi:putative glycosyltransferase (TIGR04372 family)
MLRRIRTFRRSNWQIRCDRSRRYLRTLKSGITTFLFLPIYGPPSLIMYWLGWRIFPKTVITGFGGLTALPGNYLRGQRLGFIPEYKTIILAPGRRVSNPVLLDYWRDDFYVVSTPILIRLLWPLRWMPRMTYDPGWETLEITDPSGKVVRGGLATDLALRTYGERFGTEQVLWLTPDHEAHGREVMKRFGLSKDDWWVSIHAREAASQSDHIAPFRDSDIGTYCDAVDSILDRGGWVIRTGDPKMSHLSDKMSEQARHPRVIDYVHTDEYSDLMSIFLLAECRFFIGTSAGPQGGLTNFGRPTVSVNCTPMGIGGPSKYDLFIPKHPLHWEEDRLLNFSEALDVTYRTRQRSLYREQLNIRLVDNSPEQIRDVVNEMLDRMDGTLEYTKQDAGRQSRFQQLSRSNMTVWVYGQDSQIGRDYLREHANLLPSD